MSLHLVLLDWEKAFDRAHPQGLLTALHRMGAPQHFIEVVKEVNTAPQFFVRAQNADSATKKASAGLRQGCPPSPYLFIILHTVIMHDVEKGLWADLIAQSDPYVPYVHSARHPFFDLVYADDTVGPAQH